MDHNIIEVDGVEYKAVKGDNGSCNGCAFYANDELGCSSFSCIASEKEDRVNAIYKRHYKLGK